jgi:hypothetical protein
MQPRAAGLVAIVFPACGESGDTAVPDAQLLGSADATYDAAPLSLAAAWRFRPTFLVGNSGDCFAGNIATTDVTIEHSGAQLIINLPTMGSPSTLVFNATLDGSLEGAHFTWTTEFMVSFADGCKITEAETATGTATNTRITTRAMGTDVYGPDCGLLSNRTCPYTADGLFTRT